MHTSPTEINAYDYTYAQQVAYNIFQSTGRAIACAADCNGCPAYFRPSPGFVHYVFIEKH